MRSGPSSRHNFVIMTDMIRPLLVGLATAFTQVTPAPAVTPQDTLAPVRSIPAQVGR